MQDLPLGLETFSTLRENDYLYVDKTKYIFKLLKPGKRYFLSRPRRFGKSLLISTIEELFKGNKEIFKDLFIYKQWNWDKIHPVIKLDFGAGEYTNYKELKESLYDSLEDIAEDFQIELKRRTLVGRFRELIKKVSIENDTKVVVLIDEYDKFIIDNINNPTLLKDITTLLKNFYGVLKTSDEYIEFLFVVGVSKFSGTSLFSGFNSPDDITLDYKYASICGISQEELEMNFSKHIEEAAKTLQCTKNDLLDNLKKWYNGYTWDGEETLYNPNSILKFFNKKCFDNYWFATGTPSFLIEKIKYDFKPLIEEIEVESTLLDSSDPLNIDEISLLFQTGYLTIKNKDTSGRVKYTLGIPNMEVEESLFERLLSTINDKSIAEIQEAKKEFIKNIENKNPQGLRKTIKDYVLTEIPYQIHIPHEHFYHGLFIIWLKTLGFKILAEDSTNQGSIDCVLKTKTETVVIELKHSKTNEKKDLEDGIKRAFSSINDKKYFEKYLKEKNLNLLAITFNKKDVLCEFRKSKTF